MIFCQMLLWHLAEFDSNVNTKTSLGAVSWVSSVPQRVWSFDVLLDPPKVTPDEWSECPMLSNLTGEKRTKD